MRKLTIFRCFPPILQVPGEQAWLADARDSGCPLDRAQAVSRAAEKRPRSEKEDEEVEGEDGGAEGRAVRGAGRGEGRSSPRQSSNGGGEGAAGGRGDRSTEPKRPVRECVGYARASVSP